MAAKKSAQETEETKFYLTFHPDSASTRPWIAQAFSLYRTEFGKRLHEMPEIPTVIDLCDQITDKKSGATGARYRVVATTAPPSCLSNAGFAQMIATQKREGSLRKQPTNQLWAIRDNKTRAVWICSPDAFVNLSETKTTSAKTKKTNLFRVFPTAEAIKQVAMAHHAYMASIEPYKTSKKPPKLNSIIQSMKNTAKDEDTDDTRTVEYKQQVDGKEKISTLRDYSIQVGDGVYMPVCSTAFLHDSQPDLVKADDDEEETKPPPAKRRSPSKPKASSSSSSSSTRDDDDDMCEPKKRDRRTDDDDDDEPSSVSVRAKRGQELSSMGAIVDPDDTDTEEEDADVEQSGYVTELTRSLKQLDLLIPSDAQAGAPVELHRAVSAALKNELPEICEEACTAVCKQLNIDEYDNSELVTHAPTNNLSVLRAKTGVDKDLKVPAWGWPLLLHVNQDNDADIRAYVTAAPAAIARASRDWAVQTTRPMTCEQLPKDWSPLFNAKMCEQVAMLSRFEHYMIETMRKQVAETSARARALIAEHERLAAEHAARLHELEDLRRDFNDAKLNQRDLHAKIAELEAKAAEPKLPPLPLPPKKVTIDEDF